MTKMVFVVSDRSTRDKTNVTVKSMTYGRAVHIVWSCTGSHKICETWAEVIKVIRGY